MLYRIYKKPNASFMIALLLALSATQTCGAQVFYSVFSPESRQSWLLGTIHSEDERVLDFPPVLAQALLSAYLELKQLQVQARRQLSQLPEFVAQSFRKQGITLRNIEMARRAQPLIDKGETLIAVGALHLPGDKGMVTLLRAHGNRVEAIY